MVIFSHAIKLACYQTYRDESCNSLHRNFKLGNRNTEDSFDEVSFKHFLHKKNYFLQSVPKMIELKIIWNSFRFTYSKKEFQIIWQTENC